MDDEEVQPFLNRIAEMPRAGVHAEASLLYCLATKSYLFIFRFWILFSLLYFPITIFCFDYFNFSGTNEWTDAMKGVCFIIVYFFYAVSAACYFS